MRTAYFAMWGGQRLSLHAFGKPLVPLPCRTYTWYILSVGPSQKKSSATSFCIQVARLACLSGLCVAMQSVDCTKDYLRCKPLTVWIGADMKLWFLWMPDSGFPLDPTSAPTSRQVDWQTLEMADGSPRWFWSYGDRVVLGDLKLPSTASTHQWVQVNVKQWAPKHDDWVDAKEWKQVATEALQ